ncbi:hypothetical protein FHS96_003564 [Sphingomonas zeicaulis]|uniref:hypothetical protein n=1 Tax=Sphingomonas zeicaulis TaxID=1632740 RepID=UPI003D24C518
MAMLRTLVARNMAIRFRRRATIGLAGALALLAGAGLTPPAPAQEDHSGLTPAAFRRKCLMCHSRAAPEGVSPEILTGLRPEPGLRPADAMPGVLCWRRCTTCWGPEPADGAR